MGLNTFTQSDMKQIRKQLVVDIVLNRSISSLDKSIIPRFKIPRFKTSDLIHISNQKNYKVINPKLMEELKLQANIVSWREIGGDGHCYYRAVFISIFEKILINKSYKTEFPKIILALRNAPLEYISFPSKVSTPEGKVFIQKHFSLIKCLEDILSDNVEVPAAHDLHSCEPKSGCSGTNSRVDFLIAGGWILHNFGSKCRDNYFFKFHRRCRKFSNCDCAQWRSRR